MKALAPAALALLSLSCTSSRPDAPAPAQAAPAIAAAPEPAAPPCARSAGGPGLAPLDPTGAGSSVALARLGGRTLAFVADEDDASIHTVDLDARAELARTPVGGRPAQVIALPDGRVIASLRDRAALEVLEIGPAPDAPLSRRCLVDVAAEPVGLALTPDGEAVLAASRWGHALSVFAARDLAPRGAVDLPRDPSAVVASADGKSAFVSHAVGGRVSVVALGPGGAPGGVADRALGGVEWRTRSMGKVPPMPLQTPGSSSKKRFARKRPADRIERAGSQGFALARTKTGAVLAPEVLVDPGKSATGGGYGGAPTGTVISQVAVLSADGQGAEVKPLSGMIGLADCFLPRAAAVDPQDDLLLVACLGIDTVVAYDAAASAPRDRELFRRRVGAGPTGIAVDAAGRRAVVFSLFDGALSILPIGRDLAKGPQQAAQPAQPGAAAPSAAPDVSIVPLRRERAPDPKVALGRALFHAAGSRRVAFDGRACASCHPDGRDDALTWSTPEGPRQTPMLLGRLEGTAPYGWHGDKKDLPGHFARTVERLAGTGVTPDERDALFAYIASLAAPRAPERPDAVALRARGAELFHADATGCAGCHAGDGATTDGIQHDVKSAGASEVARDFETPSLRHIGRSAPYFHDGRHATLLALVDACDGDMGDTRHLTVDDRGALAAYLESL